MGIPRGTTPSFTLSFDDENLDLTEAQSKTVTPTFSQQSVTPDSGYTHLTGVTVNAIPVNYADNAAGGVTVTIG